MAQAKKKKPVGNNATKYTDDRWSAAFKISVFLLALVFGKINHYHVSSLFENDRHFSHLSNLEREMTFRTEMGLYYSYFKTLVKANTLNEGVFKLYRNNMTEYPDTINTLKRFNLYPELVAGVLYRGFNSMGILSQQCWTVNRGEALDPVQSCEGLKDPPHFYLAIVWLCAGLTLSLLFILGVYLSDSLLGGVLTACCFLYNHGECTRVMWTPPLRESFAFPICILQILAVTMTTNNPRPGWKNVTSIAVSTSAFILSWQFAQFMLFTQSSALIFMHIMGVLPKETLCSLIISLLIGLLHSVAMMFGNEMLFCSWLFASLCACLIVSLLLASVFNILPALLRIPTQVIFYLSLTVGFKIGLSKALLVQDDAHVFEIFKSKFTDFRTFHTQLYTCAAEFDFLGWEMPWKITLTLLLPAALCSLVLVTMQIIKWLKTKFCDDHQAVELPSPAVLYTVLQTLAYAIMAILIMRLKLFFTPHLCILASLLASPRLVTFFKSREIHMAVIIAVFAGMSFQGLSNINEQRMKMGEYSDPALEEMFEWILKHTPPTAVFAGPMPTMANLLLSTERPVVNHPHYEDVGIRERTKKVYSAFSRKEVDEVYAILKNMQVDYLVLSRNWCLSVERGGCALPEVFDIEDPQNRHRPPVCPVLWKTPSPFSKVFSNNEYHILQIRPKMVQINGNQSKQR